MLRSTLFLGLIGLAAIIGLIAWQGWDEVLRAFGAAGWGIVWASLFHIIPMLLAARAWQVLMPRATFSFMTLLLWIRASVNNLMPVARIGGEVVAARVMIKQGWLRHQAIASVVVETTISVLTVFLLDIAGILLLAYRDPNTNIIIQLVMSMLVALPVLGALVYAQKVGVFGIIEKILRLVAGKHWQALIPNTQLLDRAIRALYRRTDRILSSAFWMLLSWIVGAGHIWLCLYFLGTPLGVIDCLIIEAMIQLTGSLAFAVPAALGAQEGAILLFGQLLGLSPETALALALMRRVRDLILYIPGLVAWQVMEGKWLLRRVH